MAKDGDDLLMTNWHGTSIGPKIYSLRIVCGNEYPEKAPQVSFASRVNMSGVNQTNGKVEKLPSLDAWKRSNTIETVLAELRREMASPANRKLPQPAEGSTF
ncbi:UNVERIFIED_CONTAM: E2 ubiquitin-conjugating protein mms2 [Siphonaria sp. JEL0065]|nr:E2 ubiquitin-conjugating protein mms2 [Siphonaria sp. JEL0065]